MDVSGILFCTLCQNQIELAQKKTELPCNHTIHTRCFFMYISRATIQCNLCKIPLVTEEDEYVAREEYREREQAIKLEVYTELTALRGFMDDLTKIKKQIVNVRKTTSAFRKIGRATKEEFRTEASAMLGILRRMIAEPKKRLLESQECKQMRHEKLVFSRLIRNFNRKYDPHTLSEVAHIPQFGIKRDVGYYWFSRFPQWMLRRFFFLKLQ
jgi:hypothetical protein